MSARGTTANTKEDITKNFLQEKTDPKFDEKVRDKIVTARISMLFKMPFLGNLATRLKLVNADSWLPTAATDGRHLFYNTKFFDMLTMGQTVFVVGHEILHVIYEHMDRRFDRDPQLWNVATDFAINADLLHSSPPVGEKVTQFPICYDAKYKDRTAEDIYEELYKNAEKIDIQQLVDMVMDEHLDPKKEGEGQGNGKGEDGNGDGRPCMSPEERRAIRDEIKEAIMQAYHAAGAGNVPAGIKRLLKDITQPKMNWRELIRQQIESTFKNDFSWQRPSRRSWHMDAVMPGMTKDPMIDVCISIDMSGSISDEQAKDFLSEIQGIMSQFVNYKLHVWCFDTKVYNPKVFNSDDCDEITSYKVKSGGGTDFMCNWEWMKDKEVEPKQFIMFTDGYPCGEWGEPEYCDTIFLIHNGGHKIEAPFGITVEYDQHTEFSDA